MAIIQGHRGLSTTSVPPLTSLERIALAIGEMAILRNAETPKSEAIVMFAKRLNQENIDLVLRAIKRISETPREQGEAAFPDLGTILKVMQDISGPVTALEKLQRQM